MRAYFFLRCLPLLALPVLAGGCESLAAYLATPEGQQAAKQLGGGAGGVITNPANPFAWFDVALGGGALLAAAFGLKGAGKLARKHILNPKTPEA